MIVGITRVRNEALILADTLQHFLARVDHVLLYDDASTDATPEIAEGFDRVTVTRDTCARLAWPLLKSGGWLVFDDAQRERHAGAVAWLNTHGEPVALRWAPGDVESATERLALAWRKQ